MTLGAPGNGSRQSEVSFVATKFRLHGIEIRSESLI